MADVVDKATRSRMMAGIRGRNTKPELFLRKALFRAGYRYRLHGAMLPGKPDLVFPKYGAVVFVHGCFWHRHRDCAFATNPKNNAQFWATKFDQNVQRDERTVSRLKEDGWRIAIVWECELRKAGRDKVAITVARWLKSKSLWLEIPG